MSQTDAEKNEEARIVVRAYLAARPSIAQSASTIHLRLKAEHELRMEQVRDALEFLTGLGQVTKRPAAMGSTLYYQITSAGVLAFERGE
jgi:hypothetical protein